MAKKWSKKEINEYLNTKQISQENYVAPTVQTNYIPNVASTVDAFNSVEPTIKSVEPTIQSKDINKSFSFSIDEKKKTIDDYKKERDTSYDKLMAYKEEKGINLFNEKKFKNDKKYQELLKDTQNKQKSYDDFRANKKSKEIEKDLEENNGFGSSIAKTGIAFAEGTTRGIGGIESTARKITNQVDEEERKKYDVLNPLMNAASSTANKGEQIAMNIAQSVGQMVPQIAAPGAKVATALGFANYSGSAYNDAKKEGATEDQATMFGAVSGTTEMLMDKLLGSFENIYGKKMGKDFTKNVMSKFIKNKAVRDTLSGMKGEFTEEYLQEFLEPIFRNIILKEDNGADFWNAMKDDLGTGIKQLGSQFFNKQNAIAGLYGAATSGALEGPVNFANQSVINQQQKPLEQVIRENITQEEQPNTSQLQEQPQISTQTPINMLSNNAQEQNNEMLGQEQTPQITPLNQVNQELQETRQQDVADSVRAMNLEQEPQFTQKQGNYVYEKSDNSKIDNLRKDAANYLKDGEQTTNFVNTLEKLVKDKDIEIRFDTKLGNNVNGTYKNGVITINPNSNRVGEFVAIHELTHAIGTKPMIDMIQKYRNSNAEFNNAVERLLSTYNITEINEEALGDIAGQLFGNQEYINNLSMENPSLFKKIYNEIKYLWHQFTGYKNQDQFIEDLRNKWESAYRNSKVKQTSKTGYSLEERVSGDKLLDTQDLINEIKDVGAEVDDNGYVTVYHQTTDENAQKIRKTGQMISKEPSVFFSTSKNASQSDGRGTTKLEFKIPAEELELDDIFSDNADVKIRLNGKNSLDISNYLVDNTQDMEYNKMEIGETKNILINQTSSLLNNNGGRYMSIEEYNKLKSDIEKNGIKEPIEIYKDENGNFAIEQGNHRLQIAKEIGLKEVPIKMVESWENLLDKKSSNISNEIEEVYNDKTSKRNSGIDEISRDTNGMLQESNGISNDTRTTKEDARLSKKESNNIQQTNNDENKRNNRELDNSSFSMQKDNTGRKLSNQQQEYFKNSKVRDKNGNLEVVYHGTPVDFTVFDISKSNDVALGNGLYFTNVESTADAYANNSETSGKVLEGYLDIKNPINSEEKNISFNDFKKLYKELDKNSNLYDEEMEMSEIKSLLSDYGDVYNEDINDILKKYYDSYDNDVSLIDNLSYMSNVKEVYETIRKTIGVDGIIVEHPSNFAPYENYYIAFNPNQFKNIDNMNPTTNDDIRYSKDNQTWREYLEKEFTSQGTRTNLKDINERNKPLNKEEKTELDGLRVLVDTGLINEEETTRLRELERRNKIKDTTKALNLEKETKPKYSINENAKDDYLSMKVDKAIQKNAYKNVNKATKTAENYLKFDREQKANFKDSIKKLSLKTREQLVNSKTYNQVKDIVNNFANVEYNFVDEELKSIKKEIRNTKINIPAEIREQITDYSDFRKQSKLNITKDGQNIDSVWQELSNEYPHIFSSDIQTEADMLYALSDLMNKDTKITEKYRIPDSDLKYATDKIYNSLLNNSITQTELDSIQEDLSIKAARRTRQVVQNELLNQMGITLEDIETGKDINAVRSQLLDPRRLNEEVFSPKVAKKINDATVNFVSEQEANSNRFKNKERQEIKNLGIKARSKESAAVQKYGEKEWINDKGELLKYGDEELARDFPNVETQEKIKNAARVLRNKYDNYIDKINASLEDMGYDPIPKRKDYFKHFYEISDKLSQWGVPFNANSMNEDLLPTDINGLTDEFKPGKNWFASAQQRTGKKTIYDAITGIDQYLDGASNLIFHTESIQRYRTLSKFIRDTYGQINGLDNAANLSEAQIQKRIEDIQSNKLSRYAAWLDEQANAMAGKKGKIDRGIEEFFGRRVYSALNTLKSQVGSNMTGFNVRSAMTNFASAIQGASKIKKTAFLKGTLSTLQNMVNNDGLINKSNFLTNRFGSDSISKKTWQKVANAGQIFMTGTDYFTANQIWRSKYFENMSKGMSETQAIKNADDFAARIMGDRSKGQTAAAFNSKTLGFLTQFQLEVNNQWQSMIHDNKMDIKTGNKSGATVLFQLGQLAAMSNLFNLMMKSLTGNDVMFDPIDILKGVFKPDDDDKDKDLSERMRGALGKIVDQLPMASVFTGGRIPIGEAFKGISTGAKYLTGGTNKWGQPLTTKDVKKDMLEALPYWILPTGWGQIRKTKQGLSMYSKDKPVAGSYTDSGNLRFTADTSLGGKTKSALFGQYSSKEAQDYIKGGFKTITKGNNIDELKNLGYTSSQYKKYRQELNAAGRKNQEKIDYIMGLDIPKKEKDVMASRVLRKSVNTNDIKKFDTLTEFNKWYKKNNSN